MNSFVRPAKAGDTTVLADIGAETFALACPPSTPQADLEAYIESELTAQRFAEHLTSSSTSLFVAEIQGHIAGYLMLCRGGAPTEIQSETAIELNRIYVRPQYHGTGVASALMAKTIKTARAESCRAIWLGVSKQNPRGVHFYRKHGFCIVGEQQFPVGSEIHEDYIMVHDMNAESVMTTDDT